MKEVPDISIVVLNWNTSDLLTGALDSIVSTTQGLNYDIVVIDNASTDGGFERLSGKLMNDPHFTFIQNEKNIGWAAINIMLENTSGKYIVTVDPDAIVHPNALQALFSFMEANPEAGAATAKLLNSDGSLQMYYRKLMTPSEFFFTTLFGRFFDKYFLGLRRFKSYRYNGLDASDVVEVEQPAWPCLIWRREALGAYIVDANIPFYFLDVDMSKRLYDSGYHIYLVPDAVATHLKSVSFSRTKRDWKQKEYYRSLLVYLRKYYPLIFPALWLLVQSDRLTRYLVFLLTGHEPLR